MARHLVIVGPTASGKSALAFAIAQRCGDVEIVSVDSMAVYRGMDIGTAKPTPCEQAAVAHHMIDLTDPDDDYSVARFQPAALQALAEIEQRGKRGLLVGGTGLYLDAVVDGLTLPGQFPEARATLVGRPLGDLYERLVSLDPVAASRMEPTNERRIVRALEVTLGSGRPFSAFGPGLQAARVSADPVSADRFLLVGLRVPRALLATRIARRYDEQLSAGFVEEVAGLEAHFGAALSRTAQQALGYRELLGHMRGAMSLVEAMEEARRRTVAFAKRQERWFRRDPRIEWVDLGELSSISEEVVTPLLARWRPDRFPTESP